MELITKEINTMKFIYHRPRRSYGTASCPLHHFGGATRKEGFFVDVQDTHISCSISFPFLPERHSQPLLQVAGSNRQNKGMGVADR